jgi:DNA-binding MarR family transcriptional regulator
MRPMDGVEWLDEVRRVAAFRAALRRFERMTEQAARAAGITPRQHFLLLAVVGSGERGGVPVGDIADMLQLAQSTTSGLVDRAEAAGLVSRGSTDGDARFVRVSATEAGLEALRHAMAALDAERGAVADAAAELRLHLVARDDDRD